MLLILLQGGRGWWSTSIQLVTNMACITYRALWLNYPIFFYVMMWDQQSAFCSFSFVSSESICNFFTIKMWSRNIYLSLFQHWKSVVGNSNVHDIIHHTRNQLFIALHLSSWSSLSSSPTTQFGFCWSIPASKFGLSIS